MELDIGFVCIMGIGTVFAGLICIILLCKIYGAIINLGKKQEAPATANTAPAATAATAVAAPVIEDKQKIIAAVCAAVAEELGTDVNALKVISFKKI